MARTARLTPRFLERRTALGITNDTAAAKALARAIAAVAGYAALPSPLDTRAVIPPTGEAYVRRVTGQNLWIWYRFDAQLVTFVTLTCTPPPPVT